MRFVLTNSPFFYSHLWFLYALIYSYGTLYIIGPKLISKKWKSVYAILALLTFTLFSEVLPTFSVQRSFTSFHIGIHNFFGLRALPFIVIGLILRENTYKIQTLNDYTKKRNITAIVVFAVISIIERFAFVDSQFYIGSYAMVVLILIYCIRNPDCFSNVLRYIGKKLSLYVCIRCGVKKVVFVSSGGTVYGKEVDCPLKEKTATNPISSYGVQKITIEKLLYLYRYMYGLDYRIIRLANPYGPYQRPNGVLGAVTTFTYKALKGDEITVYGDGSVVRDFIYIDDAIRAIMKIVNSLPQRTILSSQTRKASIIRWWKRWAVRSFTSRPPVRTTSTRWTLTSTMRTMITRWA